MVTPIAVRSRAFISKSAERPMQGSLDLFPTARESEVHSHD